MKTPTAYQQEVIDRLKVQGTLHIFRRGSIEHKALIALAKKGITETKDGKNYSLTSTK